MKAIHAILFFLAAAAAVPAVAQKGAAAGPILIGQSAGLTGGQAGYSADVKQGIDAYFHAVNASGGVNGRQLKLISEDDQGKKDKVVANTKKLVETDRVTALIGYTSGAGVEASLGYIDTARCAHAVADDRQHGHSRGLPQSAVPYASRLWR